MINPQVLLDHDDVYIEEEHELLQYNPEQLRTFYSLTGPARKEYEIQLAEAVAARIRIVREAQADGLLAIFIAQAAGYKLLDETLANAKHRDLVMKLAGLVALEQMAKSLGDGQATKLFLPTDLSGVLSLVASLKEVLGAMGPETASDETGEQTASPGT